jgi:hypothetical protein
VKSAAHGIDIRKRKLAGVSAIRQQDKNSFGFRFNPKTCAGKTEMSEAIFG